jgi:hypothetical protein
VPGSAAGALGHYWLMMLCSCWARALMGALLLLCKAVPLVDARDPAVDVGQAGVDDFLRYPRLRREQLMVVFEKVRDLDGGAELHATRY